MTRSTKENPVQSETDGTSRRRSRRQLLALGGAAAAAAAVAAVGVNGGKKAQAHGTVHYDSSTTDTAIHGNNTADGPGVQGNSQSGTGVEGVSQSGHGVIGRSQTDAGAEGVSQSGPGVWGYSESGPGVEGMAPADAPAVHAVSTPLTKGGIAPDGGLALAVVGKARFSTAGDGVIASNADAATVDNEAVTAESHITVTLMGNPGQVRVGWVERQPGIGFVLHTTSAMSGDAGQARGGGPGGGQPAGDASGGNSSGWDVPFTYLIVEPGA